MSDTYKNIDQLFLHKSFHELTTEEKLEISEFAKTESEFNDTKMMLISVEKELNSIQDIEPKESTKNQLLADFKKIRPIKPSQPMGLGILFPSNKPFHRKLGIQIIAIAASIVLIFILLDPSKNTLKQTSETAVIEEDKKVNEDLITKEAEIIKEIAPMEKDEINDLDNNTSSEYLDNIDAPVESKELVSEKSISPPPPPSDMIVVADKEEDDITLKDNKAINQVTAVTEELAEDGNILYKDDDVADEELAIVMDETVSKTVTTGSAKDFSNASNAPSVADNITFAKASAAESENNRGTSVSKAEKMSQVKTSKTLAENKELIKHFYTAM